MPENTGNNIHDSRIPLFITAYLIHFFWSAAAGSRGINTEHSRDGGDRERAKMDYDYV
jgi:hypothetical protein